MFIEYYLWFALTTAISGVIILLLPVLRDLSNFRPLHNMVEYSWLTIATFTCLMAIIAPLVLPAVLIPSIAEVFKKAFFNSLVLEIDQL